MIKLKRNNKGWDHIRIEICPRVALHPTRRSITKMDIQITAKLSIFPHTNSYPNKYPASHKLSKSNKLTNK